MQLAAWTVPVSMTRDDTNKLTCRHTATRDAAAHRAMHNNCTYNTNFKLQLKLMVLTVRESQGIMSKSGKVREKSEKVREFYIPKSGKVKENQSTRVQKLTKMQKKV